VVLALIVELFLLARLPTAAVIVAKAISLYYCSWVIKSDAHAVGFYA
jgi:hypothetical protein